MRVIIYQNGLLAYSETFIKQQTLVLKRWSPILLGHKYRRQSLDISMIQSRLLLPEGASVFRRGLYMFHRWRNQVDPVALKHLQQLDAQLIHAHFGTSAIDIWPYAKALKLPMLVTLHGFDISIYREWWEAGKRGRRKKRYPEKLLRMAQDPQVHFLAVSSAIRERAIRFGIAPEKISISYIGVNSQDFTPGPVPATERANRILYVGRLVEKKGAGYLIEAFAKAKQAVPDAELVIVGKGPLEEKLREQVAALQLDDVEFTGALNSLQVKEQLDNAKIFCLPSITAENGDAEGLPISILEAQASGVFVASSSSGGLNDNLLNGQTCFTFAEKDSQALAEILIKVLQNPHDFSQILENQRDMINSQFQLTHCGEVLESLYDRFALAGADSPN